MKRPGVLLGLVLLFSMTLWGCGGGDDEGPDRMTFMAGFKAQANLPFLAAYVAQEKGYFAEQDLDVDIRQSAGEHLQLLLSGDVHITTADANSVLRRRADAGAPIVALTLFGQTGQQAFVALEESGIATPKDWEGKRVGYKVSIPPDYLAILKSADVDRSKVDEVRVGFDPRILIEEQVDVLAVFKSNEPDTLRKLGFPVNVFDAADFGVPTLGLTYIATEDFIEDEPDIVRRFLKATMKGLEFATQNTEETLDIVLKFAPNEQREHMRFMMLTELEDAVSPLTDDNGLGWMTQGQWELFHDHLREFEALSDDVDVSSAYTDRFLRDIYRDGRLRWP